MAISKEILNLFNLSGDIVPLSGGQKTSVRVGTAVLKPVDDIKHSEWILNILHNLSPQRYRVSKPIRSRYGTFVGEGWACNQYQVGNEVNGLIKEKLRVSRLFHRDLSSIDFRDLPHTDNAWSKGHRIAWQIDELPEELPSDTQEIIYKLLSRVSLKEKYKVQIVHGDLSGNILFDQFLSPLVIDFSPTIAPVEYAEAILACDCIAWQGSKISEIGHLPDNDLYKEMIIRAIIFRLSVAAIFSKSDYFNFYQEYLAFASLIEYIK